jgi:hypothetical protein
MRFTDEKALILAKVGVVLANAVIGEEIGTAPNSPSNPNTTELLPKVKAKDAKLRFEV